MEVGKVVYIRYDGYPVWHARLLLARVASSVNKFIILTPDLDIYYEDFSASNRDIESLRLCSANDVIPLGVDRAETYRFRELPAGAELTQFLSLIHISEPTRH
eukprot:10746733-Karenia_brevis.AAC.1